MSLVASKASFTLLLSASLAAIVASSLLIGIAPVSHVQGAGGGRRDLGPRRPMLGQSKYSGNSDKPRYSRGSMTALAELGQ
jgi:hypothetical protein